MNKMNKLIIKLSIAIIAIAIIFPVTALGQEKKVKVKTVKNINGEEVVYDTVFTVKGDKDVDSIIKTWSWTHDGDSNKMITINSDFDIDMDDEKNIVIVKKGSHKVIHDGDGDEYRVKIITDDDGEENVFYFNGAEFDGDHTHEFHVQMDKLKDELKDIHIDIDGEKILLLKELKELEGLADLEKYEKLELLEELEELKNIEIEIPEFYFNDGDENVHWIPKHGKHNDYFVYHNYNNATEKELRDAGIKVKANRLELEDFDIDINDGIVDLEFIIKNEGSPKVAVYNYYGDKITSEKPELLNGKYVLNIDMSSKQHGTYFLHVTVKDSSVTKKFKL